jgi:hypothetical protein
MSDSTVCRGNAFESFLDLLVSSRTYISGAQNDWIQVKFKKP